MTDSINSFSESESESDHESKQEVQLSIDDEVINGFFSNLSILNFRSEEFVLDFAFIQPSIPKGAVGSRVIITPKHAKRLQLMLQHGLDQYENQVGPVGDDQEPDMNVRFSVN